MASKGQVLVERALDILKSRPDGMRYYDLVKTLAEEFRDVNVATIRSSIWDMHTRRPDEAYKPKRGLFRHTKYRGAGA